MVEFEVITDEHQVVDARAIDLSMPDTGGSVTPPAPPVPDVGLGDGVGVLEAEVLSDKRRGGRCRRDTCALTSTVW